MLNETSSHGWWGIKRGACVNVAVSKLMKQKSGVEYGNFPKTYSYAQSYGSVNNKKWTGGENGKYVCMDKNSKFAIKQLLPTEGGGLRHAPCVREKGQEFVRFRPMKGNTLRGNTYYLAF